MLRLSGLSGLSGVFLSGVFLSGAVGCDRVPEPDGQKFPVQSSDAATPANAPHSSGPTVSGSALPSWAGAPQSPPRAPCRVPLAAPAPPAARPAAICPEPEEPPPRMPSGSVTFADAPGAPKVRVELARTPAHRAHGLMYRRALAADEGMLFSWPHEAPRSFWMRNTCLPLDMLFLDREGTVLGILEQVPPMNDAPRAIPCPAMHVLELPAGWSRQHGVAPGQRLLIAEDPADRRGLSGPVQD